MRPPFSIVSLALATLCGTASAQRDILHYTFDTNSWSVPNKASAAYTGTIRSTGSGQPAVATGKPDARGKVGFALSGSIDGSNSKHNYLDTGYKSSITGSLTIAWHMRYRSKPATTGAYYIAGRKRVLGGFRIYHDGNAYLGLKCKEWGGGGQELVLGSGTPGQTGSNAIDVHSMSKNNWIHIALVIDGQNRTAGWYVNGTKLRNYSNLTSAVNIPSDSIYTFKVGMQSSFNDTCCFDIDNFRLSDRVVSATELKTWAGVQVTVNRFNVSARLGGTLTMDIDAGSTHGNRSYLMAASLSGSLPGITLGRVHVPLKFDPWSVISLGAPTPYFAQFRGTLSGVGRGRARFVVPANAPTQAIGLTIFHSGLVFDRNTGQWHLGLDCNPLVIFP